MRALTGAMKRVRNEMSELWNVGVMGRTNRGDHTELASLSLKVRGNTSCSEEC